MTPTLPRRNSAESFEERFENAIFRADQLYDLDGETFFRNRNGRIETGSWEVSQ